MNYKYKTIPLLLALSIGLSPVIVHAKEAHTVKSGDTLWGISRDYDVTIDDIKKWNGLTNNVLRIGQKLLVEQKKDAEVTSSQLHTVKSGDTLYQLSLKYKVTVANLKTWNGLKSDTLFIGQKLKVNTKVVTPTKPTPTPPKPSTPKPTAPVAKTYVVKSGDTLFAIARNEKVTVNELKTWNKLTTDSLFIGQKLSINSAGKVETKPTTPVENVTIKVGVVKATSLNVRSAAGTNNNIVGSVKNGDQVTILEEKNDWAYIEFQGKKGWVSADFLTIKVIVKEEPSETKPSPVVSVQYKVNATTLNMRKGPTTNEAILIAIPNGTILTQIEAKDNWVKATYQGNTGWVSADFLAKITTSKPNGKTVLLDAGHGGSDAGAISYDGTKEEDLNLAITLKLQSELAKRGYKIEMVRTGDTSCTNSLSATIELKCRIDIVDKVGANIFVSIHNNSFDNSVSGTETFYSSKGKHPSESLRLANNIHQYYQPAFGSSDRKVKDGNLYVTLHNNVPSVLLEVGFLSHSGDLAKLKSNDTQTKVAQAIANGIDKYFGY